MDNDKKNQTKIDDGGLFYNIGFAAGLNFAIERSFEDLNTQFHTTCMFKESQSIDVAETIDKIEVLLKEQHKHFDKVLEWIAEHETKELT